MGDAGYYFFPLLIGYTAAKKLNASPVLGIFMGAIMLHPTFVNMAAEGTSFTVYGHSLRRAELQQHHPAHPAHRLGHELRGALPQDLHS